MSSKLHFINLNPLETPQSNKDTILWFLYLNWKSPGLSGIKYSKTTIFNWENKLEATSKPRRSLWLSFPQSRDSSYKFPGATVTDLWHQLQSRSRFLMEFPQTTFFYWEMQRSTRDKGEPPKTHTTNRIYTWILPFTPSHIFLSFHFVKRDNTEDMERILASQNARERGSECSPTPAWRSEETALLNPQSNFTAWRWSVWWSPARLFTVPT